MVRIEFIYRSVLFFSRPWSDNWPHHGRTFSIYLCPLSFWLTLPRIVLSTYDVVHLGRAWSSSPACTWHCSLHYLFLQATNSIVSSWCDHSILASLLWQCLTVPSLLRFFKNPLICFLCCPRNPPNLSKPFHLIRVSSFFSTVHK